MRSKNPALVAIIAVVCAFSLGAVANVALAESSPNLALYGALDAKDLLRAQKLLDAGASPDAKITHKGLENAPLLSFAIENKSPAVLEFLIQAGADPRVRDDKGVSPLIKTIWDDDLDPVFMKKLLATKLDLDLDNLDNGRARKTLLDFAAFHRNVGAVRALLDAGADPNVLDRLNGRTPLFKYVHRSGQKAIDIVDLLLQRGARFDITDREGNTLLDRIESPEMAGLLKSYGADVNAKSKYGRLSGMTCSEYGTYRNDFVDKFKSLNDDIRSRSRSLDKRLKELKDKNWRYNNDLAMGFTSNAVYKVQIDRLSKLGRKYERRRDRYEEKRAEHKRMRKKYDVINELYNKECM